MPIYEYRCEACEHDLEAIQKFSDPELTDCPSCGAPKLRKQMSQSSFALKGGGWYADGYGGGKKGSGASAGGASTSSPSSTEAKPSSSSTSDTKKADSPKKASNE